MTLTSATLQGSPADQVGGHEPHRTAPVATVREHPLTALERHARAELRALVTSAPAPTSHDATVAAVLGWDLGLAGDELP